MKKYIFKLHFAGTRILWFGRVLTCDEYKAIGEILENERSVGILDGFEIEEVESFESTY